MITFWGQKGVDSKVKIDDHVFGSDVGSRVIERKSQGVRGCL